MNPNDGLVAFAEDLHQQVLTLAESDGAEALHSDALTRLLIDSLIEMGEIENGDACYYRVRGQEASGFGIQDDEETLNLFVTLHVKRAASPMPSVSATDINKAFDRLLTFFTWAIRGDYAAMEEASPAFDMVDSIYAMRKHFRQLRCYLFTNGLARQEFRSAEEIDGLPVSFQIWDLRRLHRYISSGQHSEPIHVDFEHDYGCLIPCLPAPLDGADYETYLAVIPGTVLGTIYGQYGPRLLELNVRSFLQARGKVNAGIRKTLKEQPERFLAYNNGISATAERVELVDLGMGGKAIKAITGLQIVNGGQTTASIYHAIRRDRCDVSNAHVQVKLTVVSEERLNEIVPLISRYANSQNKVNEADFSANDPFHVRMESLSRSTWAPATDGTQRQTKWFYERAHGQYQDALTREGTTARIRQFKQIHPSSQRFTKTDLAKFENTWDQLPHLASLGAQKNFREFTLRLSERGAFEPDERFFRHHIAKAILFKNTERVVSEQQFGGYRANIVTYTIAYLVHRTAARIDLDRIWNEQRISLILADALRDVSFLVQDSIVRPPGGRNIGEWCKSKACWQRILALDIPLPAALESELVPIEGRASRRSDSGLNQLSGEEQAIVTAAAGVPATIWFEVSAWAKQTNHLQSWQRGIAYTLGTLANTGRPPSPKQATQGLKLLKEAERLGYRPVEGAVPALIADTA